ncbi:MAG TPA: galactokinase [Solirubrobacteraceae bacterium]|nr:galactokinase [Solirubrobacteraceae bacterium]
MPEAAAQGSGQPAPLAAFGPGRVNLIGEHTDYNGGLALPFAIAQGVVVRAAASDDLVVRAHATDLGEQFAFAVSQREREHGWRAFVLGMVAELHALGVEVEGAFLEIGGDLPRGAGLSSSAALEVALCLALLELAGIDPERLGHVQLARVCARVENEWAGAQTGLLDQLASLCGEQDRALLIDFAALAREQPAIEQVPMQLDGWRLLVLDSGERHEHAGGGYNERRAECAQACRELGVATLSEADEAQLGRLPGALARRARHVLGENRRVTGAVEALREHDMPALGALLDESHASLRDDYEISTPAVEAAVARLRDAGAAGARLIGGGFGGSVLGLFAEDAQPPPEAREVRPSRGAHLLGG